MGVGCDAAIRMFEFSSDFDRPCKAQRGSVERGKVFGSVPQPAAASTIGSLSRAGKAAGLTPLEITAALPVSGK